MQATHPTRLHLARPLIITVLAVTLALMGLAARAALSMQIDPSSGAAGAPPGQSNSSVAGPVATPSLSEIPDPIPVTAPSTTPDPQPPATGVPAPADPHKVIRLSIADQRLTASEDGAVVLSTVVASGRPELPTPTGTFYIKEKYSPYTFISPWPKGDPYWYPTVTVSWAMLFADGGYFLHDSPHRTLYGPGANLANGTHGCVNVPASAMQQLYGWATAGTTVVIE